MGGVGEGFLVIGTLVAVGYLAGRTGVLGEQATEVLSYTAFWVGNPALLFLTLARAPTREVFSPVLTVTAAAAAAACLLYLPLALWRRRPAGETVIGSMAAGYVNAGNLGLPIATYTLGGATAMAPALIFQLAVLTPIYTTVLDVVSARSSGRRPSVLWTLTAPTRNPLAIGTALGIAVSVFAIPLPAWFIPPVELAAEIAVPAMLLAFGLSLVDARRPGRDEDAALLGWVVLLKNAVHPALAIALGVAFGLTGGALLAVAVSAALPTAQNVFGYAVRFSAGVGLARDAAFVSTVMSVPVLLGVVAWLQ